MGYKKKWAPPAAPVRDNLESWKLLFADLHSNLLEAGLVQTSTPGQLVINDVSALPADGAYAGFIEYALDDTLQATAPVYLKLEFGCGIEGIDSNASGLNRTTRQPRVRCTVTFKGASSSPFACPQSYDNTNTGTLASNTLAGASYFCNSPGRGFLGFVYGAGSRGTWATSSKPYSASTFTLFMQRSLDSEGVPTGDGLALYYPGINTLAGNAISGGIWANGKIPASFSEYLPNHANSVSRHYARRIGAPAEVKSANAELLFEPIYYSTPGLKQFPYLYSYNYEALADGSELPFEIAPGVTLNFMALGRETCMVPDDFDAQKAALLMLFDEN